MHPYRVFISYSHSDRHLVEALADTLRHAGLVPMWDKHLIPGDGFSDVIRRFIINCHLFMPILSQSSVSRPWVHHEIGFALGLGKAIVPISIGPDPVGIIQDVQAIRLEEDLGDAASQLTAEYFTRFWRSRTHEPPAYECAEDNLRRAQLLAEYTNSVSSISGRGIVRQMASLTSFHLPSRGPQDSIWKKYYPSTPTNRTLFDALRCERDALVEHARESGCRLILDPVERLPSTYDGYGAGNLRHRVEGILAFLRDESVNRLVVAVNNELERNSSITILGDWFSSEAVPSGKSSVLREALFTRDLPTVDLQIRDFDGRMNDLLADRGWDEDSSRKEAEQYFENFLNTL